MVPSFERDGDRLLKNIKMELTGQYPLQNKNQFIVYDFLCLLDTGDGSE